MTKKLNFSLQLPTTEENLESLLTDGFESEEEFEEIRILAATVSDGGVLSIEDELREFCNNGGMLEIFIGLDMGPDSEGIKRLRSISEDYPGLVSIKLIDCSSGSGIFHPKVYWFHSEQNNYAIVGSANWSNLGMGTSVESLFVLDSTEQDGFIEDLHSAFRNLNNLELSDESWVNVLPPSDEVLDELKGVEKQTETTTPELDFDSVDPIEQNLWPISRSSPELVMELHGESRMSQIAPANGIWDSFFQLDSDKFREDDPYLPEYNLTNARSGETINRDVISHDHQGTIEIPEAADRDDPDVQDAYLIFKRTGENEYKYQLYLQGEHSESQEIDTFLKKYGYEPGRSTRRTYIYENK